MAEQRSYTGEHIDVGVDVHKDTYTVTCICQRQIGKTATVPADPARLAESLSRWFLGATLSSAYEGPRHYPQSWRTRPRASHASHWWRRPDCCITED
jgi:hypothetical protein